MAGGGTGGQGVHKQRSPGETVAPSVNRQGGEGGDSGCPTPPTSLPLAVTLPER